MKVVLDDDNGSRVLKIDVGKRLDLTAYKQFCDVTVRAVNDPQIASIVIDFSATNQLFDSGKAILLDLIMRARYLNIPLQLVNARPEIRLKLSMVELSMVKLNRDGDVNVYAFQPRRS